MLISDRRCIFLLAVLWLLVHLFLFQHYGVRNLLDSAYYVKFADLFLERGRLVDIHHIFYSIPIMLLAASRWLFPDQVVPYLILQGIISMFAVISLYKASSKIFKNPLAGFLSGIIYLAWWDNIQWNTAIMTESLLASATCFMISCLVRFEGRRNDYLRIAILCIIVLFVRPTGIVIVTGVVCFLVRYHWKYLQHRPVVRYSIITGLIIVAVIGANLMFSLWDFTDQLKKGNIVTYADSVKGTALFSRSLQVDSDDLEFAEPGTPPVLTIMHLIIYNPIYFLKSGFLKVCYLLLAVRPYYSTYHNIFSVLWISLIYILVYFGLKSAANGPINFFVMAVILVNCALISISSVDWDNRFYIPMWPGIVLAFWLFL